MGASNSQIDSDSDPRYNIEKNSKHCSTNFQRLQYHGVRYPKGRPDPPEGSPTAQNITQSSVTLKWTPPYGCPTSTILAYQVEVCRVQDKRWKMVTNSCQGNTYDVKNLAPGTDYMFRVRTENVYGKSKPSAPSEVIRTTQ
nr:myosin light chain kinase, smooth muscle [Crassostrea gigas]